MFSRPLIQTPVLPAGVLRGDRLTDRGPLSGMTNPRRSVHTFVLRGTDTAFFGTAHIFETSQPLG